MITVVVTANGRYDLLKRTMDSFKKFNTYPDVKILIRDDSKDKIGQINSIDELYSKVDTEYIFHLEEDWEFYRPGFIEKSLIILEADPKILTVWLREQNDTNGHPVENATYGIYDKELQKYIAEYRLMSTYFQNIWHGYTLNPGLRRLSDYNLVKPFAQFIQPGDFAALTECRIGQRYFEMGYRSAILPEGYTKHIG